MIKRPVQTKGDVFMTIKDNEAKIRALGVKKIGLFGSFIREEQNAESDIDLLVEFKQGQKTFDNYMRLSLLLEELLQRPVELVTIESLSPYIRPHIIEGVEYATFSD